jgi:DeoR family transcriptional regulator, glycerol-3-phosphate regulon repressor
MVLQSEILSLLRLRGSCSINELSELFNVSGETIRRNVKPLVAGGLALKVHGGIVLPEHFQEAPILRRMHQQKEAKKQISSSVAQLLKHGDTFIIDTGSTTEYVAQALYQHKDLTVVTNSSYIANHLASKNKNRVFMAGGELRAHDAAAFGAGAIEFIQQFEVSYAILSIGAIHQTKGCMDYQLCEAEFSRAVIAQVETVIVVADATKFGLTRSVKVCELAQIDILVTDSPPPLELEQSLMDAGVQVIIAESKDSFKFVESR